MKVVLLGLFPDDPARIVGGVEAVTLRLSEGLTAIDGVEVHVIVSSREQEPGVRRHAPNLTVHSIGASDRFGNILFSIPDRRRMVRKLREIGPDIVHAHSTDRHALGALDSGLPSVISIHGVIEAETRLETGRLERVRGIFRNRMVTEVLRRARNVIYVSPWLAELYDGTLSGARRWVVENPAGPVFFETRRDETPGVVLFTGLIIPRKGIRNLLAAAALARKKAPALTLRIAGLQPDAGYIESILRKTEELGLDDAVLFLGGLSPEQLADEYACCSFLVLVSKQDTAPVSILEAMAAGKPVIGSDAGGIPALVAEGENGFIVPYGDPELLADRMVRLLGDDSLRRRMGEQSRAEAVRRFSTEAIGRNHYDVYKEILAR